MSDDTDDRYHIAAYASGLDLRRVLKDGELFVLVSRTGNIRATGRGEQGLYYKGTRHASKVELRIAGQLPLLLGSGTPDDDVLLTFDLTNAEIGAEDDGDAGREQGDPKAQPVLSHGTVHVHRASFPHDGAYLERFTVTSFHRQPLPITLALELDADFTDIFEVRGTRRAQRGQRLPVELHGSTLRLGYRGLDGVVRRTSFELDPPPTRLTEGQACFELCLEPHRAQTLVLRIIADHGTQPPGPVHFERALERRQRALREQGPLPCRLSSSSRPLDRVLHRACSDLRMLITATDHGPYPYGGLPWYSTPFGRDGLWTAMQTLWLAPHVAAGVLEFLSAHQATEVDADADAEPGKIVHELRDGEMAALHEVPFGRYYGSIDATPLYLMLAWRYLETTADRELIERLWPHLLAAMGWIDAYGDPDGDGLVEYGRHAKDGLVQQGWKDSNDSVFHRDGSLARGPVALCEVQGYVYDAKLGMSHVARALGHESLARRWEAEALALRERFDAAFWCEELKTYALALDGEKRPCRVKASNAAHCLFTGIALPSRQPLLAGTLMGDEMFSGFGIRTLAADEQRYNPVSYHNGSIWPHDNAIAARGLAAAGYGSAAQRVLEAMLDVAYASDQQRLPELLCGFPRRAGQPPTQYPVACSPQAWASGAIFMLLEAVLGLRIDGAHQRVTLHYPSLPPTVDELLIEGVVVGRERVGLRLHRHHDGVGVLVTGARDDVEVVVVIT